MFPGKEVKDRTVIVENLKRHLNPAGIAPIDLMHSWQRIEPDDGHFARLLTAESYYLHYAHPIHDFKSRLYLVERSELVVFIKSRFDFRRMEGLDVYIFTPDLTRVLVGNHDGELYLAI